MQKGYVIENLKGGNYVASTGDTNTFQWSPNINRAFIFKTWQKAEKFAKEIGLTDYARNLGDCVMYAVKKKGDSIIIVSNPLSFSNPFQDPVIDLKEYLSGRKADDKEKLLDWLDSNPNTVYEMMEALTPKRKKEKKKLKYPPFGAHGLG